MMNKTVLSRIIFFWMLTGSLLLAQKVTHIKFVGLAHLSPSMALEVADIRVGDQMDAEKIDDSIKNFFEQGYFKDVWVDRKGGTLTYHFDEKRSIANIEIKVKTIVNGSLTMASNEFKKETSIS